MKRRLAAASAVAAFAICLLSTVAVAAAPSQQGWWSAVPVAPGVPADGLLIQGGVGSAPGPSNRSPIAFAALVYEIPDGAAPGQLTLVVAASSASVPGAKLELCRLSGVTMKVEHGGPMADAPAFDCSTNVTAQPASTGGSYQFDVASLATGDRVAVAILPTALTDRVVLASPGDYSLSIAGAAGSSETGAASPPAAPTASAEADALPSRFFGAAPSPPATNSAVVPNAAVATPGARRVTSGSPLPFAMTTSARANALAVALLLACALSGSAGWLVIGRRARAMDMTARGVDHARVAYRVPRA